MTYINNYFSSFLFREIQCKGKALISEKVEEKRLFTIFYKKKPQKICRFRKKPYLCIAIQRQALCKDILGYGVMVTLQILVLSFLVRIRVSQPTPSQTTENSSLAFFMHTIRVHPAPTPTDPIFL